MSLARHNPRRDDNELEIIQALRDIGVSVQPLSEAGVPDLLWGWRGKMGLLEVKMPLGPRGGSKDRVLTPKQRLWWQRWNGPKPAIVRSVSEAVEVVCQATEETKCERS